MRKKVGLLIPKPLQEVIDRHHAQCETWKDGEPVEIFSSDGYPCVRYVSGNWWHYSVKRGEWW